MQYDVRAASAAAFGEQFYQQLVAGRCPGQVDVAVNYGRSALYVHDADTFAYGTPVLWLNAGDGRIFVPDRPFVLRAPAASYSAVKPALSGAEIDAVLAELAEFEAWLAAVPQFERSALPSALRSVETRRQEHLQAIRDLLGLVAAEADTAARARCFIQRRAALGTERDHAVRLTAFLQANSPGSSALR